MEDRVKNILKRGLSPREALDAIDGKSDYAYSSLLANQFSRLRELRKDDPDGETGIERWHDNRDDSRTKPEVVDDDTAEDGLGKPRGKGERSKVQAWRYSQRSRRDRPRYPSPYGL